MTYDEQNPRQKKLKKELQESEWLQKFKRLSEGLRQIKAEIKMGAKFLILKYQNYADIVIERVF